MPKKKFELGRLKSFVIEFGDHVFAILDAEMLLCRYCEVKIDHHRRSSVIQHLKTEKHVRAVKRQQENGKPAKFERFESKDSIFNMDLCNAMVSADIPFEKLSNLKFRKFLEIYTGNAVPSESTLRTLYVYDCYERTVEMIRRRVSGKKIWVSVDETADADGRLCVTNVVVGTLEAAGATFLLNAEALEKIDHSTVGKLFDKSLAVLWPDGIAHDDVLLFLSDASPHMVKCGKRLRASYPKMIHLTCVGRALRGVCEEIRGQFSAVDKVVGNMKEIFEKSPSRLQIFKRYGSDLPLPPPVCNAEPVYWGSWIDSAVYYCDHFDRIRDVVDALTDCSADVALSVKTVKKNLKKKCCQNDLIYIKLNFGILSQSISRLQSERAPLAESLRIVDDVRAQLNAVRDEPGSRVCRKLENVLNENVGLSMLKRISATIRDGNTIDLNGLPEGLAADDLYYYKYAPIVSVDVEKAFPVQTNFLNNNRVTIRSKNTMKHLVIQCNSGLELIKNYDTIKDDGVLRVTA